jgi:hypothetical protein
MVHVWSYLDLAVTTVTFAFAGRDRVWVGLATLQILLFTAQLTLPALALAKPFLEQSFDQNLWDAWVFQDSGKQDDEVGRQASIAKVQMSNIRIARHVDHH